MTYSNQCPYCGLDSVGNHSWECPNNPENKQGKPCPIQTDHPSLKCDKGCDIRIAELEQELRAVKEEREIYKKWLIRDGEMALANFGLLERTEENLLRGYKEAADTLATELQECEQEKRDFEHSLSELREGLHEAKKQKCRMAIALRTIAMSGVHVSSAYGWITDIANEALEQHGG